MSSVIALRCPSSRVTSLIPSSVMQTDMSVHDSTALMVMDIPGISSSLFI